MMKLWQLKMLLSVGPKEYKRIKAHAEAVMQIHEQHLALEQAYPPIKFKSGKRVELKQHGYDCIIDEQGNVLTVMCELAAYFDGDNIQQIWSHNDYEDWHSKDFGE